MSTRLDQLAAMKSLRNRLLNNVPTLCRQAKDGAACLMASASGLGAVCSLQCMAAQCRVLVPANCNEAHTCKIKQQICLSRMSPVLTNSERHARKPRMHVQGRSKRLHHATMACGDQGQQTVRTLWCGQQREGVSRQLARYVRALSP